ncbi:MAG: VWA domain-containing protein [Candidatus Sulfotelmatobacter sp.]|jgi:VWFA-related protein
MFANRCTRSATFSLCLFIFIAQLVHADDTPLDTYHSTSSEVRVTFFPTDVNNRAIDTVTKDDFVIVDGDLVIRDFRSLARADETVLDMVILVDASESVARRLPAAMDEVLRLISQTAVDSNLSVISFGGLQPALLCTGDCRTWEARQSLLSVNGSGTTPLFDAIAYGAQILSGRNAPGARPVMILFSDGDDTISKASSKEALQSVIDTGALLYTVDLTQVDSNGARGNPSGSAALLRMAEATGGRYFSMAEGGAGVLPAAIEDLRNSYVVTYELPNSVVGFHSLRILPKHNPNLRFHCRNGYVYGEIQ